LSDDQMHQVMVAAAALLPIDRDPFLRALAHRLHGETVGDGTVGRVIRELLKPGNGFFHPPKVEHGPQHGSSKLKSGAAIGVE
jgi:hypothetical protein